MVKFDDMNFVNFGSLKVVVPTGNIVGWWWLGVGWILVKVCRVGGALDSRHYRRLESPGAETLPVESVEPSTKKKIINEIEKLTKHLETSVVNLYYLF